MRKIFGKYRIRIKIFLLFILLILIPYLVLILVTYQVFQDYAGDNAGKNMEDVMISIGNQVGASLKTYEDSTMSLYYNGCVDMLENQEADREYIEATLAACCYSYSGIRAAYLVSDGRVYYNGAEKYGNLLQVMESHYKEIVANGGKYSWYATDELFGKHGSHHYILARTLNGKYEKNIGTLYYVIGDQIISNAFRKLQMEDCSKYLLDEQGNSLYSSSEGELETSIKEEIMKIEDLSGYKIVKEKGEKNIVAYNRMEDTGWIFVSCVSLSEMMQSIQPLEQVIVVISIVYCLFLILVFYIFQKSFLKPISELKYAMDQFAQGNMDIQMRQIHSGELRSLPKHFNAMTKQINELMIKNEKSVNEKNDFKIQALTAQLQPHFMYNALNTIKWMAVINRQENIQRVTEALIYVLMHAAKVKKENYTLRDELELIEKYAVIQKARFMNFEIEQEISSELMEYRIFQFILQPAVENSIIHGFQRGMVKGGKIKIRAWEEQRVLRIVVEDNGCGFDVSEWEKRNEPRENHTNIGLRNVEQIIELEYGNVYGMEIQSAPGEGTGISYRLPAEKGERSNGSSDNCG